MRQFVREFLSINPTGWTRADIKTILTARARYARIMDGNPSTVHNMIWNLLKSGDIEERLGKLYASDRVRRRVEAIKQLERPKE